MVKTFDKKDVEILRILNKNSRELDANIARKLNVSKQAIRYRIKKMQERGIIKGFYTEFNVCNLGYDSYYVFLQLEGITNKAEEDIISKFIGHANIGWVISGIGKFNIILLVYSKSMDEFENLFFDIKNTCSDYLGDAAFSMMTKSQRLSYRFLEIDFEGIQTEKIKQMPLDISDIKIMKSISQNAREKIMGLSRKTGLSPDIITYRLKKLKKEGIINGFRVKLDIIKIGLQWFIVFLKLQPITKNMKEKFINYLMTQKETYYVTSTIGNCDIMVDLHVNSSVDVRDFIFRLKDDFPELIKSYETLLIFKEYKMSYLPKID